MSVAKGNTRVTITLDGPLYKKLKLMAAEESRSLAGQIRYELKRSILADSTGHQKRDGKKRV